MLVSLLFLIPLTGIFFVSIGVLIKYIDSEIMQIKFILLSALLFFISLVVVMVICSSGFRGFNSYL